MRKPLFYFSCLLSFFIFAGCATPAQQGYKALNAGEYEKALTIFEGAAKNAPQDGELQEGLRKAQQEWLNRKLIDVRLLRLAENLGESEQLLVQILQSEGQWQVFPVGAAFATQKEEIGFFSIRVERRIEDLLKKENPLAAQVEFNKNNFVLEQAGIQNSAKQKNLIYTAAVKFCRKSQATVQAPEYFTGEWLKKTCASWDIPVKTSAKKTLFLFKDVTVSSKVANFNTQMDQILNQAVEKAFVNSRWHDVNGSTSLSLLTEGEFLSKQSEDPVSRSLSYPVEVPYEETFKRIKENKKNDTSSALALISLLTGASPRERVVDNYDGTESVTVTKYRTETRVYDYKATEIKAMKSLSGVITAGLHDQSFTYKFKQDFKFNEDRHGENFPDIGLKPKDPTVLSDNEWVRVISNQIISSLDQELQRSWLTKYCRLPGTANEASREYFNRCAHQVTAAVPEPLEQYFLKTWQISYRDWLDLTKKSL